MGTGNLTELTDADSQGVTAVLLGICCRAAHPQRAHRAGVAAHAAHGRGARRGAPSDVPRARGQQACRRATATGCCRCTTLQPLSRHARARSPRRRQSVKRRELPHRGGGRRHSHLQSRRPSRRRRSVRAVRQARRREATARTRSISATSWPRPRSRARSASAMRRTARSIGASPPTSKTEDLTQHAPEGATLKASRARRKQDAAYRRDDRDDDERAGVRRISRRSA